VNESNESLGTPIEDAPFRILCIIAILITAAAFPGVVGIQYAFFGWDGRWLVSLAIAGGIGILFTSIMATRKPWRRDKPKEKPVSARFFTWVMSSLLYPFTLHGVLVMIIWPKPMDFFTSLFLGLVISAAQALLGWIERFNVTFRKKRPTDSW
jgi:hypothetical protein